MNELDSGWPLFIFFVITALSCMYMEWDDKRKGRDRWKS